jgi:hypothetical protein
MHRCWSRDWPTVLGRDGPAWAALLGPDNTPASVVVIHNVMIIGPK